MCAQLWETPPPQNEKHTSTPRIRWLAAGIACMVALVIGMNIYDAHHPPHRLSPSELQRENEFVKAQFLQQHPPEPVATPDPTDFDEARDGSNALSLEDENGKASVWLDKTSGARIFCMDSCAVLPRPRLVHRLFSHRGRGLSPQYINHVFIPLLCRKAAVPLEDARGRISSHRARATIASQLYNAKEPLSLFELQEWLGHSSPESTRHYTKITPTKLAKSYQDAGYFARNIRAVEVLIDQDAIRRGSPPDEPWKLYDLGHGYCSYDFFDQCAHRMACARCDFYVPKQSSKAQSLEAKENLLRLTQEIPLSEDELRAIEDGIAGHEGLLAKLVLCTTPDAKKSQARS